MVEEIEPYRTKETTQGQNKIIKNETNKNKPKNTSDKRAVNGRQLWGNGSLRKETFVTLNT